MSDAPEMPRAVVDAFLVEFETLCKKHGLCIKMSDPYDAVTAIPYTENGNFEFSDNLRGNCRWPDDAT